MQKGDLEASLLAACRKGDVSELRKLLAQKELILFDINCVDNFGATPLMRACCGGHIEIIEELLELDDIDINKGPPGDSPLISSLYGNIAVIQKLLAKPQLDINAGNTALCEACQLGNIVTITCLLDHPDIDINKGENGSGTPLYISCISGSVDIVNLLLSMPKIDVNRGGFGFTPLYAACEWKHSQVVRVLVRHPQIDVNKGDKPPIDIACVNKYKYIVIRLMLAGSRMPNDPQHQKFIAALQDKANNKHIKDACK